jgi:hypothetical protein
MRRNRVVHSTDSSTAINIPVPQEDLTNSSIKRGRLQMQFDLGTQELRNRRASFLMYVLICAFLLEVMVLTAVGFVVIVMHIR